MATLDDAARLALALPDVTEAARYGNRAWLVAGKAFAWERPFSKADIKRFGDTAPPAGRVLHHPALRWLLGSVDSDDEGQQARAAGSDHRRLVGVCPAQTRR